MRGTAASHTTSRRAPPHAARAPPVTGTSEVRSRVPDRPPSTRVRSTRMIAPAGTAMAARPSTAAEPDSVSSRGVTVANWAPGFTSTRSRSPPPSGIPAITSRFAGACAGGMKSTPLGRSSLGTATSRTAAATRPLVASTSIASSSSSGASASNRNRTLELGPRSMPLPASAWTGPAPEYRVMSNRAGSSAALLTSRAAPRPSWDPAPTNHHCRPGASHAAEDRPSVVPSCCRATTPASAEGAQEPSARMRIGGCERFTERSATGSPGPGSWTP